MKKSIFTVTLFILVLIILTSCDVTPTQTTATTAKPVEITTTTTTEPEMTTTESVPTIALPAAFPQLDSSTARIPITDALYALFTDEYGIAGPKPICSKTHQAWLNLADSTVDLILCIAPTDEEREYLDQKNVDVEMRLYGCDGLVFLGNSANPVKNLTQEQIKGIYRGDIVNWSELGGPDAKITAYYRDDQSGSQRFFEDLVWKDETLPDFTKLNLFMSGAMEEITDMVIYDPYAIGFNIMSYIDQTFSDKRLMFFSVDGIAPSTATLADNSYVYKTQAYVIINADEPADSSARVLFNWFGCDKSRELIAANSSLSIIFGDPILLKTSEPAP